MKKCLMAGLLGASVFLSPLGATPIPAVLSLGEEETMPGGFDGRLPSVAVDSKNQPHLAVDGASFVHFYDKVNGGWIISAFDAATVGSSQYYNPHLEIDAYDRAWISGVCYGNLLAMGLIIRTDMATAPSAAYFSPHTIVPMKFPVGNLSLDPAFPDEAVLYVSEGLWEKYAYDLTAAGRAATIAAGTMWTGFGGEKNTFWISKAGSIAHADGTTHAVWHAAIGGYARWDSSYQNSVRNAQGLPPVTWASYTRYPQMEIEGIYVGLCSDNQDPQTAYMVSAFRENGVCLNIWNGSEMVFNPGNLLLLDLDGEAGEYRYAPQLAPAKYGGVFCCWTRSGRIKIRYVAPNGATGPEVDVSKGDRGGICTDPCGNLHVVYNRDGQMQYRKILVSGHWVKGDYDGDGKSDLAVYGETDGLWQFLLSARGWALNSQPTLPGYRPLQADFDGDGKTDITLHNPDTGQWLTLLSQFSAVVDISFGLAGDQPVPADYDGDGLTDVAVYRPSTGEWHFLLSSQGYSPSTRSAISDANDSAVPADFDGDFKVDPAVYNPLSGRWTLALSSQEYDPAHFTLDRAVSTNDLPCTGDYNGDGYADFGVYNPDTGWLLALISADLTSVTQIPLAFCAANTVPVSADFDGDGATDLVIYNTTTGQWSALLSRYDWTLVQVPAFVPGSIPVGN